MIWWLALAGTLIAELLILRRLRFDGVILALVAGSMLLCSSYLGYTSVDERNYDGETQVRYVQVIAEQARLPDVDECGPCGHPPLYYALGALWSKTALAGGWLPLGKGLQWLSLVLFFGFALVSLAILRDAGVGRWTLRLAAALVLFWPSSIINSVRVHNDALASLLMLGAMYFLVRWDVGERPVHFYAALAAAALALLTKANGYAVAASLLFFVLLRLRSRALRPQRLRQLALAVTVLAGAALLATSFRHSRSSKTVCQQVLGHACDGRYVPAVVERPSRYLYFDVADFVGRLDVSLRAPEHDYFLNRLAKSSLFGVMSLGEELGSERHQRLGAAMSVLLLFMVSFSALALPPLLRGARLRKYRGYVVSVAFMFAFLLAFRLRVPNEFHEDFRHVFPALVPFCLGYAGAVGRVGRYSRVLGAVGAVAGGAMVLASVAFFFRAA
jgi:hypothetical protein